MIDSKRPKILEVIVNSLEDAIEAEQGGADRLEVVRDLDQGGLTPDLELVHQIAATVQIPIRVMLRENSSMQLKDDRELNILCRTARQLTGMRVEGLVAGFVKHNEVDIAALRTIAASAPQMNLTFHRAFDELPDPVQAIGVLKTVAQVDRILTIGGLGSWPERRLRLQQWQRCAAPEIIILAGAGLLMPVISDLRGDSEIHEMHIGRAARIPPETSGRVSRVRVAQLKGLSA